MTSILFICTGNIFRSVAAEYALKSFLPRDSAYIVGSAGIRAELQHIPLQIRAWLRARGADPSSHVQRKLTRDLLEETDLAVAMSLDHRDFIRTHFDRDVPLFNEICYQKEEPVLDIHEAVPDWPTRTEEAYFHGLWVVNHIWASIPAFADNVLRDAPR